VLSRRQVVGDDRANEVNWRLRRRRRVLIRHLCVFYRGNPRRSDERRARLVQNHIFLHKLSRRGRIRTGSFEGTTEDSEHTEPKSLRFSWWSRRSRWFLPQRQLKLTRGQGSGSAANLAKSLCRSGSGSRKDASSIGEAVEAAAEPNTNGMVAPWRLRP
jgi:hypothetical protein